MKQVEYFFAPVSGFAYLGHRAILDIAAAAGAEVIFRPFDIQALFTAQGTVPPPMQGDLRLSYRREDMVRWAARRGLPLNPVPAHWPVTSVPACKAIIAAAALGHDAGLASEAFLAGIWAEDRNLADPAELGALLDKRGLPGAEILAGSKAPEVNAALQSYAEAAREAGVFGSPTYIIDGVRFFGQDRLEFVSEALTRREA